MKILVVNIGTTSLKYRLYDMESGAVMLKGWWSGSVRRGIARTMKLPSGSVLGNLPIGLTELNAIGFKAVHAGSSDWRTAGERRSAGCDGGIYVPRAGAQSSLHRCDARFSASGSRGSAGRAFRNRVLTAKLPERTLTYSVPYEWKEKLGIRRYGFHGASHRAASERAQELLGRKDIRHISIHLGGSSSLAAIRNGVALDSSFGISAQSGIPHNNRTGDVDAYAVLFAMKRLNLGVDEMATILSSKSGLAGMSGTTGDMRDIEAGIAKGDPRCQVAMDVFVKAIRNYIGAFLVELGGVDVLTFLGRDWRKWRFDSRRGLQRPGTVGH